MSNLVGLIEANRQRRLMAGQVKAVSADVALTILSRPHQRPRHSHVNAVILRQYQDVLRVRAFQPKASLTELAETLGLTKHQYSARLRRALAYAQAVTR